MLVFVFSPLQSLYKCYCCIVVGVTVANTLSEFMQENVSYSVNMTVTRLISFFFLFELLPNILAGLPFEAVNICATACVSAGRQPMIRELLGIRW